MIRKAEKNDIKRIMEIIKTSIEEMGTYNNTQWNSNYPAESNFLNDIESGCLFLSERDNIVCGLVCVNFTEPLEYKDILWSCDDRAVIVHRMAVDPSYRKKGIGTELMKFSDDFARENNIKYLKTDTYSINDKMINLFTKCGYNLKGTMQFLGKEKLFNCYDKILNN